MDQARSEEEEKKRKRDRKDRGQVADGKKGSPNKTKTHRRNENKAYLGTAKVNKLGEERLKGLLDHAIL